MRTVLVKITPTPEGIPQITVAELRSLLEEQGQLAKGDRLRLMEVQTIEAPPTEEELEELRRRLEIGEDDELMVMMTSAHLLVVPSPMMALDPSALVFALAMELVPPPLEPIGCNNPLCPEHGPAVREYLLRELENLQREGCDDPDCPNCNPTPRHPATDDGT